LVQPALQKRLKKEKKVLDQINEDDSGSEEEKKSEVKSVSIQSGVTRES
jgi:hypothetical protein